MQRSWIVKVGASLGMACALGCMPELVRNQAELKPSPAGEQIPLVIGSAVDVRATEGFQETLEKGSTWKRVGSIVQGDVYKRIGGVFMLTSRNAHEAYLVVSDGKLVGFYLPGEGKFAPASTEVALPAP